MSSVENILISEHYDKYDEGLIKVTRRGLPEHLLDEAVGINDCQSTGALGSYPSWVVSV